MITFCLQLVKLHHFNTHDTMKIKTAHNTRHTSTWSRAPKRPLGLDAEADSADEPSYCINILVKLESLSVKMQPLTHTNCSN